MKKHKSIDLFGFEGVHGVLYEYFWIKMGEHINRTFYLKVDRLIPITPIKAAREYLERTHNET